MAKTYTAAGSATAGEVYTSSAHNVIVTDVNNFIVPPMCRAALTSAINPYTSNTDISWSTDSSGGGFDTDGMWDSGQPARVTFQTAGVYIVTFGYNVNHSGTITQREGYIRSSVGGAFLADDYLIGSFTTAIQNTITTTINAAAGDYVTARFACTGGSSISIQAGERSFLSAVWVGRTA